MPGNNHAEGQGIACGNAPELTGEEARQSETGDYSDDDARADKARSLVRAVDSLF